MRPLEVMLLSADLLTLLIIAVPGLCTARCKRFAAAVVLLIVVVQVAAEGPRWQMFPAYSLTLLLVSVATRLAQRKQLTRMVVGLAMPWLAVSVALPIMAPVFAFPTPTGPYAIGTLIYHWIDATRSNVFAVNPQARRHLLVQVWYPARANLLAPRAPYMPEADAVTAAFARIHGMPAFIFGHFTYLKTHAAAAASVAVNQPNYPVLLFLEGATGFRQMNTFQVEHLVAHGYVVVAIDQPGAASIVVFPDGHQESGLTLPQTRAAVGPSYLPGTPPPNGTTPKSQSIIPYLAQDVVFTLDQLSVLNQADPNGILTGKLDMQRVGGFGVSLGGIVVSEACRLDARMRACLMIDAPMPKSVVAGNLQQPSMWITRDAGSMRLERLRAGGWPETEIKAHQNSMRAVYRGLSGAGYFVQVPGTFHSNFTDIASWTPVASLLGFSGPINAQRAHDIINDYSLAFFNRHLVDLPTDLLDGPTKRYPDVMFESRRRTRADTSSCEWRES